MTPPFVSIRGIVQLPSGIVLKAGVSVLNFGTGFGTWKLGDEPPAVGYMEAISPREMTMHTVQEKERTLGGR